MLLDTLLYYSGTILIIRIHKWPLISYPHVCVKGFFFEHVSEKKKSHYFITSGHCTGDTGVRGAEWIIRILTHWGWDKRAAILQTTFSNSFSWMKIYEISSRFCWNLFLRVPLKIFKKLVEMIACCQPGNKPLSEPKIVKLQMHRCIMRTQWLKTLSSQKPMINLPLGYTIIIDITSFPRDGYQRQRKRCGAPWV